jgi:hypothetical protein
LFEGEVEKMTHSHTLKGGISCKRNSRQVRIGKRIIRVDSCLAILIEILNADSSVRTLASCCGHGKYHASIVAEMEGFDFPVEIFSGQFIHHRKKRFYVRDENGFYYIPEASLPPKPKGSVREAIQ